jgi:membrane protein required for colicin V production
VDIGAFLTNINRFDLLVVLFLFGMFVLGFIQGTIRRVLGLASMLFSFLFAANLRDSLGVFLASNWNQFPDEYAVMIGFGAVFAAATIAFTLVIQGFYHRQPLFEKQTIVDEVLGGILGVIQGLFVIGCIIVILDSFFRIPGIPESRAELPFLRGFFGFYDPSGTAALFRNQLIPAFYLLFGLFIPANLKAFYVRPS